MLKTSEIQFSSNLKKLKFCQICLNSGPLRCVSSFNVEPFKEMF